MKKNKIKINSNLLILGGILILVLIFIIIIATSAQDDLTSNKIALIKIKGSISLYNSGGLFSSGGTSAESTIKKIERAEEDSLVKAIILEINSGGGTVVASKEIANAVKNAEKPVVAWIREIGASGAYWIASASDIIIADSTSMTGSIGVRSSYIEVSKLFEKYGLTYQRIVSGEYKDIGSPYKNLTKEEYDILKEKIDIVNNIIIQEIKNNRNLDTNALDRISTAEILLGVEAINLGLVDILGSKEEAISYAEELASIDSSRIVTYVKEKSFTEKLVDMLIEPSYFIGKGIGDSLVSIDNKEILLAE